MTKFIAEYPRGEATAGWHAVSHLVGCDGPGADDLDGLPQSLVEIRHISPRFSLSDIPAVTAAFLRSLPDPIEQTLTNGTLVKNFVPYAPPQLVEEILPELERSLSEGVSCEGGVLDWDAELLALVLRRIRAVFGNDSVVYRHFINPEKPQLASDTYFLVSPEKQLVALIWLNGWD